MPIFRIRPWKWKRPTPAAPSKPRRKKIKIHYKLLIIPAILVGLLLLFNARFRPLLVQIASNQAKYISNIAITSAVSDTMADAAIRYGDLIYTEKTGDGNVAVLRTNIAAINALKSELTAVVQEKLASVQEQTIQVAIGTLIGSELTFGRGPKIPVKVIPLGTVTTNLKNNFSSAGINQTKHEMIAEITAVVSIIIPGNLSTTVSVTNDFTIAQTIIVGAVPDAYTNFNGDFNDGDVIDFGATKPG